MAAYVRIRMRFNMPASRIQIVNGSFQDSLGNVLDSGYLIMELNQDGMVTGVGQVCSGIKIHVPLNSSGNVVASPATEVWPNDVILPINSFYIVSGYTAEGQLAWGPNNQQVISGGATYDLDAWIPNQLTNWTPPLQAPLLETNGVVNGLQSLLDLTDGSNITIVDDGHGGVTISNTYAYTLPPQPYDIGIPIVGLPGDGERIGYIMPRTVNFPANFSTSYASAITASTGTIVFNIYKNTSTLVGTVTFTASATGVFASASGLAQSFVAGDLFELVCPSPVDATWADGRFSIIGTR